jgi:nucleoside recognition membrane protein YjiH
MGDIANEILSDIVLFVLCGVVPGVTIWGWVRWMRRKQARTVFLTLSQIGLVCATVSAFLALSSTLYYRSIPGYNSSYADPLPLVIINRAGSVLALAAVATAICGTIRPNLLRWQALVGALGALFFWLAAGMGM